MGYIIMERYKLKIKNFLLQYLWKFYKKFKKYLRIFDSKIINQIEVHLAEHCNLKCAYCTHNCPVAEPEFPNIEQLERDFTKLSKLTNGHIRKITLLGGEPLLNPNIVRIIQIVRQNIPVGKIEIITNGILLTSMKEEFWIACKNNNISVIISQYPIKLDIDKISKTAKAYCVNVFWRKNRYNVFYNQRFDMSGKRDIYKAYENCIGSECTFLKEGKIYICPRIPCSKHLEKRFDVKFSISSKDFLVLDKVNNLQEILDFISHPSPFCKYCAAEKKVFVTWKISERKKEEWIMEEDPLEIQGNSKTSGAGF